MSDKITVEELKIFVGTGLQCEIDDPELIGTPYELLSIETWRGEDREPVCLVEGGALHEWCGPLSDIVPIVRPVSQLSDDEIIKFPPEMMDSLYLMSLYGVTAENTSFGVILALSQKHYDIFNWLNKTREDGTSLAVEKEIP